ncbi:secreted protein [methanotrophic bacterial endosymbiont of Bathymodiolus sp.]|nr:secreted protein [methanotrophic bacterial endosymbiont of Bathymodiolus sp.]
MVMNKNSTNHQTDILYSTSLMLTVLALVFTVLTVHAETNTEKSVASNLSEEHAVKLSSKIRNAHGIS